MAATVPVEIDELLGQAHWIDRLAVPVQQIVRRLFAGPTGLKARNILNGVWLGHPLHAALTDLPVGAYTLGILLDYLGLLRADRHLQRTADLATGAGWLGALAAAAAGLADYSVLEDEPRRVGLTHGALNVLGVLAYTGSMRERLAGRRATAVALATVGYALIFTAAELGGQLVYHLGTLVNRQAWNRGPAEFTPVLPAAALGEGELRSVEVGGFPVLLTRVSGRVYALGNTCTHWGCRLDQGHLEGTSIICHCHGSQFDLRTGAVINGPATAPEVSFDVRERDGRIEVCARPY
ncbi:MAG TPA: Rieske (2Fe-2S) protein [Chloroflexota bacterium]|nr:Rieske (2Fe-2S) protein [Chloroflexota bacterium]